MSETQPSEMKPKKMVRRSVAIALGIICIIFVAGLGGAFAYYVLTHNHANSDYDALQNQVSDLTDTLNLGKHKTWVDSQIVSQSANNYTSWHFNPNYAGFVSVEVQYSSSSSTYVEVIWYFDYVGYHGYTIEYIQKKVVGFSGGVIFPILKTGVYSVFNLEIRVGNSEPLNGATENVTITYIY